MLQWPLSGTILAADSRELKFMVIERDNSIPHWKMDRRAFKYNSGSGSNTVFISFFVKSG